MDVLGGGEWAEEYVDGGWRRRRGEKIVRDWSHRARRWLQVRAEGQEAAVAVFDYEFAGVPGHVAQASCEFDALGGVLGIEGVGVFHEDVGVEEFFGVFVRVGGGRFGAAEVDGVMVARDDGVDRWVEPGSQALEAQLFLVVGERGGNVPGEELRCDLLDHLVSVLRECSRVGGRV